MHTVSKQLYRCRESVHAKCISSTQTELPLTRDAFLIWMHKGKEIPACVYTAASPLRLDQEGVDLREAYPA